MSTTYQRAQITAGGRYHVFYGPPAAVKVVGGVAVIRVSLCGRMRHTAADSLPSTPMWTWDEPHPMNDEMDTCRQCRRIWEPFAKRRYQDDRALEVARRFA